LPLALPMPANYAETIDTIAAHGFKFQAEF